MMKYILCLLAILFSSNLYADLPLTVENLISDKGKVTLESSLIYGNSKAKDIQVLGSIPVQVGTNAYISLPTQFGNSELQSDYLVASVGAKYGISKKADIGIRVNGIYHSQRNLNLEAEQSRKNTDLSDISLTGSYQILNDDKYPAIVAFSELGLIEKRQNKNTHFSNLSLGLTTYRSYDPVVLSLTAGYKHYLNKTVNQYKIQPSNILFINPQVAFIANDRVSLLAGVNFRYIGTQKIDDTVSSKQRNDTDFNFGVGYGLNNHANLTFMTTLKQGFDNSSEFRLSYSKKFK